MAAGQHGASLFLHLGPPRTATTALQSVLQREHPSFAYLGKWHSRKKSDCVSTWLHDAVAERDIVTELAERALNSIRSVLDQGRHAVVSEEMLLVDGTVTHQEKLRRVAKLLDGIPAVAIICLRDPVDALPSLFQERYRKMPPRQRQSFDAFLASNQAKIFDYVYLLELLDCFTDTRTVRFEDVTGGVVSYRDIFGPPIGDDTPLAVDVENAGARGDGGRRMPKTTLRDVLRGSGWVSRRFAGYLSRVGPVRSLWRWVGSLEVAGGHDEDLVVPVAMASELRRKWLQARDGRG